MKKAFTIVELLVVMAVIGILITLAVVGIQAVQKSQREVVRTNDLRNIQSSLEAYYSKNRQYPISNDTNGDPITVCNVNGGVAYTAPDVTFCPTNSTTPGTLFAVKLQALGGDMRTGSAAGISGWSCTAAATSGQGLQGTADVWTILYKTAANSPQSYTLLGCTENGFTTNLGTY